MPPAAGRTRWSGDRSRSVARRARWCCRVAWCLSVSCAVGRSKIVVDSGFAVVLVHYRPLNSPRSPNPPRNSYASQTGKRILWDSEVCEVCEKSCSRLYGRREQNSSRTLTAPGSLIPLLKLLLLQSLRPVRLPSAIRPEFLSAALRPVHVCHPRFSPSDPYFWTSALVAPAPVGRLAATLFDFMNLFGSI